MRSALQSVASSFSRLLETDSDLGDDDAEWAILFILLRLSLHRTL